MITKPQFLKALRTNFDLPTIAEALVRLSKIAARTLNYSHLETLSIAMDAKSNGITPQDLKTQKEWSSLSSDIKFSSNLKTLDTVKIIEEGQQELAVPNKKLIDISQTNANALSIPSLHPSLNEANPFNQNLLNDLISQIQQSNHRVALSSFDEYNPKTKAITLNQNNPLEDQAQFLINSYLSNKFVSQNNELSHNYCQAIINLSTHALLDRLNIDSNLYINLSGLTFNLSSILEDSDSLIKSSITSLNLDNKITLALKPNQPQQSKNPIKSKSPKKSYEPDPNFPKFEMLTDIEMKQLSDKVYEEIVSSDPALILSALHVDYTPQSNRYKINAIGGQETGTSSFRTHGNDWFFKRYGSTDKAINIIEFAKIQGKLDFKEAIEFCRETLGIPNYFQQAIDLKKLEFQSVKDAYFKEKGINKKENIKNSQPQPSTNNKSVEDILKKAEENTKHLKDLNLEIAKKSSSSWVHSVSTNISPEFRTLMRERGLVDLPPEALEITIAYTKQHEDSDQIELKTRTGIGLLCGDYDENLKIYQALGITDTPEHSLPLVNNTGSKKELLNAINNSFTKTNPNKDDLEKQADWDLLKNNKDQTLLLIDNHIEEYKKSAQASFTNADTIRTNIKGFNLLKTSLENISQTKTQDKNQPPKEKIFIKDILPDQIHPDWIKEDQALAHNPNKKIQKSEDFQQDPNSHEFTPKIGADIKFTPIIFENKKSIPFNPDRHKLINDNGISKAQQLDNMKIHPLKDVNGVPHLQYTEISKFKTQTAGIGTHTILPNSNISNIRTANLFEGMTDEIAPLNTKDIHGSKLKLNTPDQLTIIANSVSNADKINADLAKLNINKLNVYTQFDSAAIGFLYSATKNFRGEINLLNYAPKDFGKDVNDIQKERPNICFPQEFTKFDTPNKAVSHLIANQADYLKIPHEDLKTFLDEDTYEQRKLKKALQSIDFTIQTQTSLFQDSDASNQNAQSDSTLTTSLNEWNQANSKNQTRSQELNH